MEAKAIWNERMSFTGSADSGFTINLDASTSVGGNDGGFRPMELIAIGLAGCTAMDVISLLNKKRQDVAEFEVRVHADLNQDHPQVFTDIQIEYIVRGQDIDKAALNRAIELSMTKYCPAMAMLRRVVPITTKVSLHNTL